MGICLSSMVYKHLLASMRIHSCGSLFKDSQSARNDEIYMMSILVSFVWFLIPLLNFTFLVIFYYIKMLLLDLHVLVDFFAFFESCNMNSASD